MKALNKNKTELSFLPVKLKLNEQKLTKKRRLVLNHQVQSTQKNAGFLPVDALHLEKADSLGREEKTI